MKKDYITNLYQRDYLSDTDVYFARFIGGLNENNDPDISLAAALVSRAVGNQDVYLDLGSVAGRIISLELNGEGEVKCPEFTKWLEKIRQSRVVGRPGDFRPLILDNRNRLYLYRYWAYEKKLSDDITKRISEDIQGIDISLLKDSLIRLFPDNADDRFNWQKLAAVISAFKKLCVITGGPGTGKTFTVAKILALLLEQSSKKRLKILLAAPTGKASARISESIKAAKKTLNSRDDIIDAIPSDTYTIHRMLKTIPGSPYFRHNAENPLNADVVVVDEGSMVDLALMSKLLAAVPNDARFILIGDRDQLASVETGFVMADICDRDNIDSFSESFSKQFEKLTQQKIDVANRAYKNKPGIYDCMVVLKKSYRFTQSGGIEKISRAVNNGDIDNAMFMLKNNREQIFWQNISGSGDLTKSLPKRIIKGYSGYLQTDDPRTALELFNRFRILCAVKLGSFGVNAINRFTEQVLIREGLIEPKNLSVQPWYRGRPVLVLRNDYSLELFNGDVGIAMPDPNSKSKDLYVYFPGVSGELRRFHPYRLPEHETAYAISVHKSQGSEFDDVIFILPDRDYPVLTRELIYTGITRAKKNISIWAMKDIFKKAILRKIDRTSGLKDALWG